MATFKNNHFDQMQYSNTSNVCFVTDMVKDIISDTINACFAVVDAKANTMYNTNTCPIVVADAVAVAEHPIAAEAISAPCTSDGVRYCINFSTKHYPEVSKCELIKKIEQNKVEKKVLCEIFNLDKDSTWVRPYIDVDYAYDGEYSVALENSIRNDAVTWFCEQFGVSSGDIAIASDHRPHKLSFHIVADVAIYGKDLLEWKKQHEYEMKSLYIDVAPYGKTTQKWKTLYSPKPGDVHSTGMTPLCGNIEKHMIQLTQQEVRNMRQWTLPVAWKDMKNINETRGRKKASTASSLSSEELVARAYDILRDRFHDTTSRFHEFKDDITLFFRRTCTSTCCWNIVHKMNGFLLKYVDGKWLYHCYGNECLGKFFCIDIEMTPEELANSVEHKGVKNDLDAARRIFKLYPHWVCCNNVLYVFDKDSGMWKDTEQAHLAMMTTLEDQLHCVMKNKKGEWVMSEKGYGNDLGLMRRCLPLLKTLCVDNEWYKRTCLSSRGKLLFRNGILDLYNNSWTTEFDPDVVFRNNIDIELDDDFEESYMEDVYHRLFVTPLGADMAKWTLTNLARGLAGDMMKRFIFGIGDGDSGKSTLVSAFTNTFGNMVGTFNAENMTYRDSSCDAAAEMRWGLMLADKRLIFSNELKSDVLLNGNALKKFSSGGDVLIGRMHNREETEFIFQGLMMIMTNDINKIKPCDDAVTNRMRVLSYEKVFKENPSTQFELKADIHLKDEIQTLKFKKTLVRLVIRRYFEFKNEEDCIEVEPEKVTSNMEDWIGDKDDMNYVCMFQQRFEITNDIKDFTKSAEMDNWVQSANLGISFQKFTNYLKKHCTIHGLNNIKKYKKSIQNKNHNGWLGIKDSYDNFI